MSRTGPTFAERHAAVESVSRLARWAVMARLVVAAVVAVTFISGLGPVLTRAAHHEGGRTLSVVVMVSDAAIHLVAEGLFLTWLYRAVSNARALGLPLKWGPIQAVVAQAVPVISLVLPYYVMTALHRASDPSALHDAPMFRVRAEGGYREGAREALAPPRWHLPAPILAWCILCGATTLSALLISPTLGVAAARYTGALGGIATGVLGALVVRSIDARQRERCRRLEATETVDLAA